MDTGLNKNLGRLVFIVLVLFIGSVAFMYLQGTEPSGMGERFSSALGISHDDDGHHHHEGGGFALEVSPFLYILVLAILCISGLVLYRKFGA